MAITPLSQAVLQGMDPNVFRPLGYMKTGDELFQQGSDSSPTSKWGAIGRLAQALSGTYLQNSATSDLAKTIAGGKKSASDLWLQKQSGPVPSAAPAMTPTAGVASPVPESGKVYANNEPSPLDPPSGQDRKNMVATILGEAGNEPQLGKNAVASVIRTRAVDGGYGGDTPTGVVTAPKQFEPWNTPEGRTRMAEASADPKQAAAADAAIASAYGEGGKAPEDPTGGMTHFYSPTAQAALGRAAPPWAGGESVAIGRHVFNSPDDAIPANATPTQGQQPLASPQAAADPSEGLGVSQLLQVLHHPYASDEEKALAKVLLVQKLTPKEDEFASGPQGIYNRRTGELKQPASQDEFASSPQGIFNKHTGELKQGGTTGTFGDLQGKDLLTKLQQTEPGVAARAQAIIEGRAPYPTSSRLNSADMRLKELVPQIDPTFEVGNSGARVKVRNEFNAGGPNTPAGQITAGNTAIQHLAQLMSASEKIGGTNNGWIANSLLNKGNVALESAKNDPNLVNYNNSLGRFAEEATKFYRGIGGSESDIKRAIEDLGPGQSPEARSAAIKAQAELMHSKINALQDRWKQGMGPLVDEFPIVHEESKKSLDIINGKKAADDDVTSAASASAPKTVSTKADYDALPAGHAYGAPDGSIRTKR